MLPQDLYAPALDSDAPAVGLNDAAYNRQTQATAFDAIVLSSVESLKDALLVGRRDAGTAILHPQPHVLIGQFRANLHLSACGSEL